MSTITNTLPHSFDLILGKTSAYPPVALGFLFLLLLLLLLLLLVGRFLFVLIYELRSPLRSIPGPFLARFTRLWWFYRVSLGNFEKDNITLHRQYGPIVRIAPGMYSIDTPEIIKKVYGPASKFPKSAWYDSWKHPDPKEFTLFPDRQFKRHAETRKKFQALYSMSSVVGYQPYIDECTSIFHQRLTEFAQRGEPLDMGQWFQFYAFDVIGNFTFSQRFGFLDKGADVSGLLAALRSLMLYGALVGVYPHLHPYLFAIMGWLKLGGVAGRNYITGFVKEKLQERKSGAGESTSHDKQKVDLGRRGGGGGGAGKAAGETERPPDFLARLLTQNQESPERVTMYHVTMMGLSNVFAGSDTTSISLSAVLYNLIRTPRVLKKLRDEIDRHHDNFSKATCANFTFQETQNMPYLQAVIKESLRLHPATGLPLWRDVPQGQTVDILGYTFTPGTTIGLNTWVAHYNEEIFGEDVDLCRPERWIPADDSEESAAQVERMNQYYFPFGLGARTCIGRHMSTLEISKAIPSLVNKFDFELEDPTTAWQTQNHWFVKPTNFRVRVKLRQRLQQQQPS